MVVRALLPLGSEDGTLFHFVEEEIQSKMSNGYSDLLKVPCYHQGVLVSRYMFDVHEQYSMLY